MVRRPAPRRGGDFSEYWYETDLLLPGATLTVGLRALTATPS